MFTHEHELEEVFFERYFEPGEDTYNLQKAKELFEEAKGKAEELAQDFEDGLVVDESESILIVQNYCLAKKFLAEFSK